MFNGILRGLQLMADFLKLFVKALEAGNAEAIRDGTSIAKTWISETVNETGIVRVSSWSLAFGNSDPWRTSRQMYAKFALRWNGKL